MPPRRARPSETKYYDPSDSEDIPFAPPPPPKKPRKVNPDGRKPGRRPKVPYLDAEMKVAIKAVLKASELCQSVFKALVTEETLTKKDKSPVTVADFGAQAIVNALLSSSFPEDPIVGEEDSKDLHADHSMRDRVLELVNSVQESPMTADQMTKFIDLGNYAGGAEGRFWTLDPIDGTKGFLRGEQFAVCLALVNNGKVELGVIGCPNLPVDLSKPEGERGCLFIATRGYGAFTRSFASETLTKIKTTNVKNANETVFCESVEAGHTSQSESAQIAQMLHISGDSVRMDSQCKYGVVARGDAGIYLRLPVSDTYEEKIWDHAGGMLIVQEAGGIVTDIDGKPLDFSVGRTLKSNKGVVATSKAIHEEVLNAVRTVLKRPFPSESGGSEEDEDEAEDAEDAEEAEESGSQSV
ncbi:3(2),5-bisphosphate nucleotidase HAL2 [Rhizoclosmatium globosum]|uniref:3'(2'),5'-bisphosphate nucleotidase n=1 Tax=Rhizoclosmatium globosum TaxID=329046 RepID=A0A1Y2CPS3_9FUNG|nr:3(2),5-bisphosphate nucleotidase HAL2 [Rhizoclosmatium globosum]|eukprot:ORY49029.1 3(2),5-bisphosphate nucleotidase HAL2 [Rhizoclosmatium globosum]